MRNYEMEKYSVLMHYNVPGAKRPHGLKYKTKHHMDYYEKGPISTAIGDGARRRKRQKWINQQTSKIGDNQFRDSIDSKIKPRKPTKGETQRSLRLLRLKMLDEAGRAKYRNKKNRFRDSAILDPALNAGKPETQTKKNARDAIKKAAENSNPYTPKNVVKKMKKQVEKAKKAPSTGIKTGVKSSGSNVLTETRKKMEKQVAEAKRQNRMSYEKPSTTTKTTYVTYTPRDKNTNAPRPGHKDEKVSVAKDVTVKSKLYKRQKKK